MTITAEKLRNTIFYNPDTGAFTWLRRPEKTRYDRRFNTHFSGKRADHPEANGYTRVKINGSKHLSHRLAFLYMTGAFPAHEVDHINRDRADNRWCNLRDATKSQNQSNRGKGYCMEPDGRFRVRLTRSFSTEGKAKKVAQEIKAVFDKHSE